MGTLGKKIALFIVLLVILIVMGKLINRFVLPLAKLNSESMYPTYNKGDILFYSKSSPYNVNDVIIFYSSRRIPIVVRIIEINPDSTYKAKGDNPKTNPVPIKSIFLDETRISKEQILGKILFSFNPIIFYVLVYGIEIIIAFLLTKLISAKFLNHKS